MKNLTIAFLILITGSIATLAQEIQYQTDKNIPYYESQKSGNEYIQERCMLDIYFPKDSKGFATIVWFHGGGLTSGQKEIPQTLKDKGFCIVAPNYRLSPRAKSPEFIEDAAAAVAWVFNNIQKYGGDPSLIFLSGHSAGGYLDLMVGLDKKWLKAYNIDANRIAGLIPFSPQVITHFTIRKERGISDKQPIIDEFAPLYHVRADAPMLLLITGDKEMEMLGRYEENAYMARMMKLTGHKDTRLFELQGFGHNMTEPAFPLLIREVGIKVKQMKGPK